MKRNLPFFGFSVGSSALGIALRASSSFIGNSLSPSLFCSIVILSLVTKHRLSLGPKASTCICSIRLNICEKEKVRRRNMKGYERLLFSHLTWMALSLCPQRRLATTRWSMVAINVTCASRSKSCCSCWCRKLQFSFRSRIHRRLITLTTYS